MICPRCSEEMTVRQVREVAVDSCAGCDGVFLDRGELNRVAETIDGDLEYSTVHGKTSEHPDAFGPADCPGCSRGTMQKVEFLVHTGIVLDHCRGCGGFWLDGQELQRINETVRALKSDEELGSPAMRWFADLLCSLPR